MLRFQDEESLSISNHCNYKNGLNDLKDKRTEKNNHPVTLTIQ